MHDSPRYMCHAASTRSSPTRQRASGPWLITHVLPNHKETTVVHPTLPFFTPRASGAAYHKRPVFRTAGTLTLRPHQPYASARIVACR